MNPEVPEADSAEQQQDVVPQEPVEPAPLDAEREVPLDEDV
ncbi:hypothetical protein AB0A63_07970 [Lentzea sp. NPDC042327]